MRAEGTCQHSPKTPTNGKLWSFRELTSRPWLRLGKREEGQTTGRTFRLAARTDCDSKRSSRRKTPWPLVSEDVCEAWITGKGQGCDPKGQCQPVTQKVSVTGVEGPWHFFWPKALRQRWTAAIEAQSPAVSPLCPPPPSREPGCPWSHRPARHLGNSEERPLPRECQH